MTNKITRKHLAAWDKAFLALAVVLAAISLVDFVFYGNHLRDLLLAIGFALMAYGTFKNGIKGRPDSTNDRTFDKRAQYLSGTGVALAIAGIIMGYVQ